MALDSTDKRMVKGLIWLTVLGSLAYVFPGFWFLPGGYRAQKADEAQAYDKLTNEAKLYRDYHREMSAACLGVLVTEPPPEPSGMHNMSELKAELVKANDDAQQLIEAKEKASRISFPEWARVPEGDRDPGVHFIMMWERKKNTLATELIGAKVECDDPEIGFRRFEGVIRQWDVNKTEEYLRELFIAERIIQLCILAKLHQEQFEKSNGFEPEAFMRIMKVTPSDSVPTGPSALLPNPKYDPAERNPNSERFRKYKPKLGKLFIQEYPVQILLECDVNSYMRFLHSVRKEGQFLVIRTLQIVSPFLKDSRYDKSGLSPADLPKDPTNPDKQIELKPEHILVTMSAAGMDFFDPVKNPHGLYEKGAKETKAPIGRGRRMIQAPAANP